MPSCWRKLEQKGLQPSRGPNKRVLLRRVTYDLTGLPPTAEEQAEFLADHSPDAYEKVVDRLLASPRYGERWSQHWFDVVRYAETDGFKNDWLRPDAYKYRDYVIRSLNNDLPYDRFIREQLAGDELEPNNPQALIATGLNRLYPDELNASDLSAAAARIAQRRDRRHRLGIPRADARLRPMPRSQVRSDHAGRLLSLSGDLRADGAARRSGGRHAIASNCNINSGSRLGTGDQRTSAPRSTRWQPGPRSLIDEAIAGFDADTQQALNSAGAPRTPLEQHWSCKRTSGSSFVCKSWLIS